MRRNQPSKIQTTQTIAHVDYNSKRNQATLKLRGRPIVVYAPDNLNKTEITDFYKKVNNFTKNTTSRSKKSPPKGENLPENADYTLESAFGYRGNDCRKNLYTLKSREIIYFVAGVVIIQDPFIPGKQRLFNQHTDDIKCLAVHSDGIIVASGQISGIRADDTKRLAHILIWNSNTLKVIKKLGENQIFKGPISLSFSYPDPTNPNNNWIGCIDEHNDHYLRVWNWSDSGKNSDQPRIEKTTTKDTIAGMDFLPNYSQDGSLRNLIIYGKQLSFYTLKIDGGKTENKKPCDVIYKKRNAIFEKTQKPKIIVSVCVTKSGGLVTGGTDGLIVYWGDNPFSLVNEGKSPKPLFMFTAHKGPVFSIVPMIGAFSGVDDCFVSVGLGLFDFEFCIRF